MQITSPLPYFILMPLFYLLAAALSRSYWWREHRALTNNSNFNPRMEGLRGILAMSVFFYHAVVTYFWLKTGNWEPPPSHFYAQLGPFPVTMFFFITGFLFWTKILKSQGPLPVRAFLMNRIRRVYPVYFCAVVLTFGFVIVESQFRANVPVRMLILQAGQWFLSGVPLGFPKINSCFMVPINGGVFWTLRIEWAFYLLLPWLKWFAKGLRLAALFAICGFVLYLNWAIPHGPTVSRAIDLVTELAFYLACCFSFGMLAATLKARYRLERIACHPACTPAALALLIGVLFIAPPQYGLWESLLLAPIFVMVIYGNRFHGLLTSAPLLYLGTISYSIYVLHGLILHFFAQLIVRRVGGGDCSAIVYWALIGIAGISVIAVSSLSYRFVELPLMTMGARGARNKPLRGSICASSDSPVIAVEAK
jgi:peptidoglycan/LPS O-acetylase OafA/YrhL